MMTNNDVERGLCELFDKYVPFSGKADTIGGEVVRAISRIVYRNFNDGDCIGVEYGNETCNAPARYLKSVTRDAEIRNLIDDMWGNEFDYDDKLEKLEQLVYQYVMDNEWVFERKNDDDMWNYREWIDTHYEEEEED